MRSKVCFGQPAAPLKAFALARLEKAINCGFSQIKSKSMEDLSLIHIYIGCAMGTLVAALRDRGVNAYGIDISEYAISQVPEDIRPYCRAQSALENLPADFPTHYDMVSCIEMIEHLEEPDGLALIKKMCTCLLYTSRCV